MLRNLTLIFALSLILAVVFPVVAHSDFSLARRHAPAANRMIRKRAGFAGSNNAADPQNSNAPQPSANAAPVSPLRSPTSNTDTVSAAGSQSFVQSPATDKPSAITSAATTAPTTSTSAQSSSASSTAIIPSILNPVLGSAPSANATVSSSSSTSSTSSSSSPSSSTPRTSSSASSTPSSTQSSTPTTTSQSQAGVSSVTITTAESAASSSASTSSSSTVTKLQRNTIIILVAIGASLGAAGIIWTIIRKWKFRPSSSFEDRMQPIDWQPTTEHDDRDMTERLARHGSTRSHGSFTSGNNHDNLTVDLPPHDFTAGAAHLAPVGGYADLQRGPSPQPDLQRGPSSRTPGDYHYEIPNPHGQYYTGAGVGTYQGGYESNRGY